MGAIKKSIKIEIEPETLTSRVQEILGRRHD
jgi:hypothetical protein